MWKKGAPPGPVGVLQVDVDATLGDVRDEVAVTQHDALGNAGGPRRVGQDGHVRRRIERHLRRGAALTEQGAQIGVSVGTVEHDDPLGGDADGLRLLRPGQQRAHRDEPAGPGIAQLLLDLAGGVQRVDRRHRRAGAEDAVEDGGEGGHVRAQQTEHGVGVDPRAASAPAKASTCALSAP
jgi:hypothetical protein